MGNFKCFDKIKIMEKENKKLFLCTKNQRYKLISRNRYPVLYIIFMPPKNLLKPH